MCDAGPGDPGATVGRSGKEEQTGPQKLRQRASTERTNRGRGEETKTTPDSGLKTADLRSSGGPLSDPAVIAGVEVAKRRVWRWRRRKVGGRRERGWRTGGGQATGAARAWKVAGRQVNNRD